MTGVYCASSEWAEFGGHCYRVYDEGGTVKYSDCKTACEGMGAYLAVITSQEENDFIASR